MISGPAVVLQHAIYRALHNSIDVSNAFGGGPRIYDEVPSSPVFPYVVIGDDQVLDDSHCETAFEVHSTIHVFSRKPGAGITEAKTIGDALIATLGDGEIDVDGFISRTSDIESALTNTSYFYEPDRLTAHGVLVFRFLLDQS